MSKKLKKIFEQPTFASSGGLKEFNDEQRAKGWESIGKEPPEATQFNSLQNDVERGLKYLYAQIREVILASSPKFEPDEGKLVDLRDAIAAGFKTLQNALTETKKETSKELSGKLAKDQNGADIPDPVLFVKNLGLGEGSALPVGAPIPWPLSTAPLGWLKCNGAAFTAAQYPRLAQAYPGLKLPDLRGEFIRGWDDGRGVDAGRALLSAQSDLFKAHHHSFTFFTGYAAGGGTGAVYKYSGNAGRDTGDTGGNETRPRNIAFNYIVRAA